MLIDVRLDLNEGAHPSARLLDHLSDLVTPELLRRYPDSERFCQLIGERLGIPPWAILPTAGANDGLNRACRAFLHPGQEIILPLPTYDPLERFAYQSGARVVTVPWLEGPFPCEAVLAAVTPTTALIAVVSPQNPTGGVILPEELERLARSVPTTGILLDMAYGEFAEADLSPIALRFPNIVMIRTLSKAWGLAGLRIGYAVTNPAALEAMGMAGMPYPQSALSLAVAEVALSQGDGEMRAYVEAVGRERLDLTEMLTRWGAQPWPSQGNFLLVRFRDAGWVQDALAGLGIAVRGYAGRPGLSDCLRITCPAHPPWSTRLRAGLEAALAPQAVLLATPPLDAPHTNLGPDIDEGQIKAALLDLGVTRAWLVGSSPQSLAAARAAGVVPIGLGDAELLKAGASRVVDDLAELPGHA